MADVQETRGKEKARAEVKEMHKRGRALQGSIFTLVIAVGVGMLAWWFAPPPPQRGVAIGSWRYTANLTELRSSKERWGLNGTESWNILYAAAEKLAASFVLSTQDDGLYRFLNQSSQSGVAWAQFQHAAFWSLQRYLGWSRTDASALLQRKLYVASEEQMRILVGDGQGLGGGGVRPPTLLDIGSGTGSETEKLAAALGIERRQVTCLESSFSMRALLAASGFQVASSVDEITGAPFRAVALLNVLDRCDDPLFLLNAAIELLEPDGLLILATPLPFDARVYEGRFGSKWGKPASRPPRSPLILPRPVQGTRKPPFSSFEFSAAAFLAAVLPADSGVALQRWTRLPYLSSGDLKRTHYAMDMAVFALRVPAHAQLRTASDEAETPRAEEEDSERGSEAGREGVGVAAKCRGKGADAIFAWVSETLEGEGLEGWGEVLDAGAGFGSMCWLLRKEIRTLTEVTASADGTYGGDELAAAAAEDARVEVVQGNWRSPEFMARQTFNVVVADYLLGAVEYHWPFGAGQMMDRLLEAVRPGGFVVVVGMEPYEAVLDRERGPPEDAVVLEVEALGDAAAALAGGRTYRELPEQWVLHQVRRHGAFAEVATRQFPMKLSAHSLRNQLRFARKNARAMADAGLRKAFLRRADELDQQLADFKPHRRARNYAIVAQRREG